MYTQKKYFRLAPQTKIITYHSKKMTHLSKQPRFGIDTSPRALLHRRSHGNV